MIGSIFSAVASFTRGLFNPANYTLPNLVVFVMVLMCIQYIPIETRAGVSPIKTIVMAVMPLVLLSHFRINRALILGIFYMGWLFFTAGILHPATFRASTILYTCMFVITFIVIYTAVWNYHIFTLDNFIKFMRLFFFVLIGFLLAQQACLIVGIKLLPLINLCQVLNRGIGANSLTFEPSTLGRLLAVMYYALLKCLEIRNGEKVTIKDIFKGELKWVSIFYIWAVLTMGSGTAFVAAGITSLYFMRGWYFLLAVPIFIGIYFSLEYFGNESFSRAQAASIATISGDADVVRETDGSASMRIAPLLTTLKADFSDPDIIIGKGCDSVSKRNIAIGNVYMGHIDDYGLISYVLELIIVFTCCINFRSLGSIYFFTGTGGGIGNISYGWGLLLIFCCLKYFYDNRFNGFIYEDDELTE